jgi:hypothetical protein
VYHSKSIALFTSDNFTLKLHKGYTSCIILMSCFGSEIITEGCSTFPHEFYYLVCERICRLFWKGLRFKEWWIPPPLSSHPR